MSRIGALEVAQPIETLTLKAVFCETIRRASFTQSVDDVGIWYRQHTCVSGVSIVNFEIFCDDVLQHAKKAELRYRVRLLLLDVTVRSHVSVLRKRLAVHKLNL